MSKTNNKFRVKKPNLILGLLSVLNGLFINVLCNSSQVLAQETSVKNNQQLVAPTFPNWQRISLNDSASIMLPGDWDYDEDGIYSLYGQTYYMAYYMTDNLDLQFSDTQTVGFCNVINCKAVLTLAINEVCKEENWILDGLNSISVVWQGHSVEAIEFSTNDLSGSAKMKGRLLIAGNTIYFLAAATEGHYFDNDNVDIFLNSFSQ